MKRMKNIQIVDGALNATYSIFQATEAEFRALFPGKGQDMEIALKADRRLGKKSGKIFSALWERPIAKKDICGLHGTLFYNAEDKAKYFPRSMRERDWSAGSYNEAQRRLFGLDKKPSKAKKKPPFFRTGASWCP